MGDKLIRLYNTLMLIETKGESTKTMAQCLNYIQALAEEAKQLEAKASEVQSSAEGE